MARRRRSARPCGDDAGTTQASGGCTPPGPPTRWSPLRGDCAALRSPQAHGRTRGAACGRSAQTCGRESEVEARGRAPPAALCCSPPRLMAALAECSRHVKHGPQPASRPPPRLRFNGPIGARSLLQCHGVCRDPVQGGRISFMTPCATLFSRPLRMDDTPQENAKN